MKTEEQIKKYVVKLKYQRTGIKRHLDGISLPEAAAPFWKRLEICDETLQVLTWVLSDK